MHVSGTSHTNEEICIEVDDFEILTVHIGNNRQQEQVSYLRYVSNYTLVELGISLDNGQLISITLVQASGLSDQRILFEGSHELKEGFPLFDLSLWKGEKLLDIKSSTEFILKDSSIIFLFNKIKNINKIIKNKNLECAISQDGYLCFITLKNLNDIQVKSIEKLMMNTTLGNYLG